MAESQASKSTSDETPRDLSVVALGLAGFMLVIAGFIAGSALTGMFFMSGDMRQMSENNSVNNIYVRRLDEMLKADGYPTPDLNEIRKKHREANE